MKFISLELKGFLAFPQKTKLDLSSIQAATVCGPNGAGKSSLIIDPIPFALFGKARKKPEELINDLSDSLEVTFIFSHHGKTYKVVRGIKRGKNQTLKLFERKKDISERLATATQKKLDDLLGFSYDLLMSTAVAQQDEVNLLSTMQPGEREKILSEMLAIQNWEEKKKKVLTILNDNKNLLDDIKSKESEYKSLEAIALENIADITIKEEALADSNKYVRLMANEENELEESRRKSDEFNEIKSKKAVLESEIENLREQYSEILPEATDLPEKLHKLNDSVTLNQQLIQESRLREIDIEKETNLHRDELNNLSSLKSAEVGMGLLTKVPCVGMDIQATCQLLKHAREEKLTLSTYLETSGYNSLDDAFKNIGGKITSLNEKAQFIKNAREKLQEENIDLAKEITEVENYIASVENGKKIKLQIEKKSNELESLETELKEVPSFDAENYKLLKNKLLSARQSAQNLEIELARINTKAEETDKQLTKLAKEIAELQETENKLANYKTLYVAYNEIPSLLFEQAIPFLETYTNEILEKISPGKRVQLRSFKETKSNTVKKSLDVISSTATGMRDFDNLSGSEKFRQSLALRIALSRYCKELHNLDIPFMIVDEGFGSLDNENTALAKSTLQKIASEFELFLMVTHVDSLKDTFDHTIIVNPMGKGERVVLQ